MNFIFVTDYYAYEINIIFLKLFLDIKHLLYDMKIEISIWKLKYKRKFKIWIISLLNCLNSPVL